jgi:phage terminase large subunit GpA-like protein
MIAALTLLNRVADAARAPRLRTLREFAEQEIVLPTGPHEGERFKCAKQPFSRLFFDEVDSGRWRRVALTGPSQTGKTLIGLVIIIMYHLFEVGEDVIFGAPTMTIAMDKWRRDILPVVRASRYAELLPRNGAGSRGGTTDVELIEFGNGRVLRIMTGGGDDKSRSNYTARVLATTETDGLDESSEGSREADKVSQLEARTQAFGSRARIYHECTASLDTGRIWQEITKGTDSKISIRCPHCRHYVTPEREHLVAWQEAQDELEAGDKGRFCCPSCGTMWEEKERIAANHDCLLVHRGQEVTPDGAVTSQPPRTDTLGFRWNAANNLLVDTATVAKAEWKASRASDEDNANKKMLQFWWARPHTPDVQTLTTIDPQVIMKRLGDEPRGRIPSGAGRLTVGIDVGKYFCHWTAIAWLPHATPHVIEYGRLEVHSNDFGEERAILAALREFRDGALAQGWPAEDGIRRPVMTAVDCGNWQDLILDFCGESPDTIACKGFGVRQMLDQRTIGQRSEQGWKLVWAPPGAGYELMQNPGKPARMLEVRADQWKSWFHARLKTPVGQPGALTLHSGGDHFGFAKHLVAEKKVDEFVAGKGMVERWDRVNRNNHFLDSSCLACVAGHASGERLIGDATEQQPAGRPTSDSSRISSSDWLNRGRSKW